MNEFISEEGIYDFAPHASQTPPTAIHVKPIPVVSADAPPVVGYMARKNDKVPPVDVEQIKNLYLPAGLLAGGIFIELLATLIWTHRIGGALVELVLDLTVGTAVMLLAMFIAAKIRAIDLGKIGTAILKLAAIAVAPQALMEFVTPVTHFIPLGFLVALLIQFVMFFALLGALFDLDESDTWYCVCILCITRIALFVLFRV